MKVRVWLSHSAPNRRFPSALGREEPVAPGRVPDSAGPQAAAPKTAAPIPAKVRRTDRRVGE